MALELVVDGSWSADRSDVCLLHSRRWAAQRRAADDRSYLVLALVNEARKKAAPPDGRCLCGFRNPHSESGCSQSSMIGGSGGPFVSHALSASTSGPTCCRERGKARLLVNNSPASDAFACKALSLIG